MEKNTGDRVYDIENESERVGWNDVMTKHVLGTHIEPAGTEIEALVSLAAVI